MANAFSTNVTFDDWALVGFLTGSRTEQSERKALCHFLDEFAFQLAVKWPAVFRPSNRIKMQINHEIFQILCVCSDNNMMRKWQDSALATVQNQGKLEVIDRFHMTITSYLVGINVENALISTCILGTDESTCKKKSKKCQLSRLDPLGSTILSMQIIFDIGIEQPSGGFLCYTKTGSYLLCDVSTSSAWHRDIILKKFWPICSASAYTKMKRCQPINTTSEGCIQNLCFAGPIQRAG